MSLKQFADALPDYARDLRLNLSSLLNDQTLGDQRKYGLLLACAHATGYKPLVDVAEAEAEGKLSGEAANAARAAAAVMAMNNVYYRFVHLASNPEYATLPARLRMNVIGAPGIDKADFELFSLAVSAMNGCGMCIDSHERVLQQHKVKSETIQNAVRIAAVVKAPPSTPRSRVRTQYGPNLRTDGTEIVEGRLAGDEILEIQRLNFALAVSPRWRIGVRPALSSRI